MPTMSSLFHRRSKRHSKVLPFNASTENTTTNEHNKHIPNKSRTTTRNPITRLARWWSRNKRTRKADNVAKAAEAAEVKALDAQVKALDAELAAMLAEEDAAYAAAKAQRNKMYAMNTVINLDSHEMGLDLVLENKDKPDEDKQTAIKHFDTYCNQLQHIYPTKTANIRQTRIFTNRQDKRVTNINAINTNANANTNACKNFEELYAIYLKNFDLHWDNKMNIKDRLEIALFKPNFGTAIVPIKTFSHYIKDINIKIGSARNKKSNLYNLFWDMEKVIKLVNKSQKLIWYDTNKNRNKNSVV